MPRMIMSRDTARHCAVKFNGPVDANLGNFGDLNGFPSGGMFKVDHRALDPEDIGNLSRKENVSRDLFGDAAPVKRILPSSCP